VLGHPRLLPNGPTGPRRADPGKDTSWRKTGADLCEIAPRGIVSNHAAYLTVAGRGIMKGPGALHVELQRVSIMRRINVIIFGRAPATILNQPVLGTVTGSDHGLERAA
jgi:hypothetical protein